MKIKRIDFFVCLFVLLAGILLLKYDASIPDYATYKYVYENSVSLRYAGLNIEPLYLFLCKACNRIGWSYNMFLVFFVTIGIIILWNGLSKYAENKYWILLAYIIFPFYTDTVQIRNFMAYAIVIYGCRFLIEECGWKRIAKFMLSIVIASGFHFIALVYLSFLVTLIDRKKIKRLVPIGMGIILALGMGTFYLQSMIMSMEKYKVYFQGNKLLSMNMKNAILITIFVLMNYTMATFILKKKKEQTAYDRWFEKINDFSLIYLVIIVLFGNNFYRIFRNLIPLYYIEMSTLHLNGEKMRICRQNNRILYLLKCSYPVVFLMAFELNELWKQIVK